MTISGFRIKDAELGPVPAEEDIGRPVVVEVANVEVIVEASSPLFPNVVVEVKRIASPPIHVGVPLARWSLTELHREVLARHDASQSLIGVLAPVPIRKDTGAACAAGPSPDLPRARSQNCPMTRCSRAFVEDTIVAARTRPWPHSDIDSTSSSVTAITTQSGCVGGSFQLSRDRA